MMVPVAVAADVFPIIDVAALADDAERTFVDAAAAAVIVDAHGEDVVRFQ
jgi:hypothetical protein